MIHKDDVKWWILEAKKHPESIPTIIEALARRLIELDEQNERLRDELIQLQHTAPTSIDSGEVDALRDKVDELQSLLSGEASGEPSVVFLSHDLRVGRLLLSRTQRLARQKQPALNRQAMLGLHTMLLVRPQEELMLLTNTGYGHTRPLSDAPPLAESGEWPQGDFAKETSGERLTAAIAVAQPPRFWTLVTRRGYVQQLLRIDLERRIAQDERVIESPFHNDGLATVVDGDRGDLLVLTRWGKGVRFPQRSIESQGSTALKLEPDDRVVAALPLPDEVEMLILTASGFAVRRDTRQIAARAKPGGAGKGLIQAFDVLEAFSCESEAQLLYLTYSGKPIFASTAGIPLYRRSEKGARVCAFDRDPAVAVTLVPQS